MRNEPSCSPDDFGRSQKWNHNRTTQCNNTEDKAILAFIWIVDCIIQGQERIHKKHVYLLKHASSERHGPCQTDKPLNDWIIFGLNFWVGGWIQCHGSVDYEAPDSDMLISKLITTRVQHFPFNGKSSQVLAALFSLLLLLSSPHPTRSHADILLSFLQYLPGSSHGDGIQPGGTYFPKQAACVEKKRVHVCYFSAYI